MCEDMKTTNIHKLCVIDKGLDEWQWQESKIEISDLYWANCTRKVCMGIELLLLCNVCVVSEMLKVDAVERQRLSCLKVIGGN